MTYIVKTTGRAALKNINLQCPECKYEEERSIDQREKTDEEVAAECVVKCPNCDHESMELIWKGAPSMFSRHGTDAEIAKYKKYSHERFVKKDIDDVRHKHGVNYDDSIRSATATKIKKRAPKGP